MAVYNIALKYLSNIHHFIGQFVSCNLFLKISEGDERIFSLLVACPN